MRYLARATLLELRLLARDPMTVVFTLALPVLVLFVLGNVFGNVPNPRYYRGVGPMDYYVPAYVGLAIASMGLVGLPVHLAGYRERGILKRLRASDVPVWSVVGGQVASTVIAGVAGSGLVWLLASLTFHVALPGQPLLVVPAFLLSALCFGAVGVLLGMVLPTARAAQGAGTILWFVMMMVSGTGPPVEVLNGTLLAVGDALPLRHVVLVLQGPWLGFGWDARQSLFVLAYLAASAALTALLIRHPPRWPVRRRRAARPRPVTAAPGPPPAPPRRAGA